MTQIRRQIDRIIISLKQQAALQNVRFVREYGSEPVETPIYGMLAAVGIVKTARDTGFIGGLLNTSLRGESYSAEVEIRVYAPQGENGNGLSELVSELLTGLEQADEEKLITRAAASSIEFDPNLNTIFRRLSFTMEFCLCEEGQRGFSV